jgi:hypothetical protein
MSKLITYFFEAICIAMMFLFIVGFVWGIGSAILKLFLMGVSR